MALRNILTFKESRLRKTSRPVKDFDKRLNILIDDMRETLLFSDGVGLAAPQVGVLRRVCLVMDTNREGLEPKDQIIELINPEIVSSEGGQTGLEGCLSNEGVYGIVTRPMDVTVKAFDRNGNEFTVSGTGLTARAFCHEIDHLDGILFTDLAEKVLTPEELQKYLEEHGSER